MEVEQFRPARPDAPRAYRGPYPIRSHRTLAQVWGLQEREARRDGAGSGL